jgi:hypothetical protein
MTRERHRPSLPVASGALILVCLCFFVLQWMLFPHDRPPAWDESVYISQVTPGVEAAYFAAWRARGITLLVAPAIAVGASLAELRLSLIVLATLGTGLALSVWRPLIGMAAPVAAFLFSFTWIALLNGSQVMPNFWTAVLGLIAAGFTVRWRESGHARHAVLAAAALAATALVRPTEATVIFVILGSFVLLSRKRSWSMVGALLVGLAIGWAPWLIEMSLRFGGPLQALREAAAGHIASAPITQNLLRHLSYTDGELLKTVAPLPGVIWWVMLGILSVVGLLRAATHAERTAAVVASLIALAVAIEYMVFVPALAPRFLLPAYAFAAIPASIGVVSLFRGRGFLRVAGVVVVLFAVPWAIWQAHVAQRVESASSTVNGRFREVGEQIRGLAAGHSCSVMSRSGLPQIQLASGCVVRELPRAGGPTRQELEGLSSRGDLVFVIMTRPPSPGSPLEVVRPIRARDPIGSLGPKRPWLIYELPESTAEQDAAL